MKDYLVRLAIVGVGKIVHDQHLPHIRDNPAFRLVAAASRHAVLDGVPIFPDLTALLDSEVEVDAVAVCTPPQARYGLARQALDAGKHVLLEKPPGATVSEVEALKRVARNANRTLYATWHSRHAPGVDEARRWLRGHAPKRVEIVWREDVRRWHPGQAWIWQAGGLGVFDPGINALSIATRILPPFFLRTAELSYPSNCETPIAASLRFELGGGGEMTADFDFRQTGPQIWDIRVEAEDGGAIRLSRGGAALEIDGRPIILPPEREYGKIYDRFAELIADGDSDADTSPLAQVADALMLGRRVETDSFYP